MSGEIFHPMDKSEAVDAKAWNPLQCPLCTEPYDNPCILSCFHSFCQRCLRGRDVDSKMVCPVCGVSTLIKEGASLPPQDPLLKFMVESTTDEKAPCANCDSSDCSEGMFYCNTCCQPLCAKCRDDTHRARMFVSHDVVLMTKRTRDIHKRCSLHGEPYIMFSMEKKIMLCINCFRDMRIESRTHCVDLETAYNQSCKKLDHSVQAIRDLQHSVQDGILLLRALLEEIQQNADKERCSLLELYEAIIEKMKQTKDMLVEEVDSQYNDKKRTFKAQLKTLTTLLPTLHVHLVMSLAFSSSTNKFEFLDLAYVMMDRLKSIVQKQHPLHPTQSGQIDTGHKTQFAKSLEPLLVMPQHRPPIPSINTHVANRMDLSAALPPTTSQPSKASATSTPVTNMSPVTARRSNGLNGAKVKFIDAKGPFADHCVEFETAHREVMQRLEKLKTACQEVQRDITVRRCLGRKDHIMHLQHRIETLQGQLEAHFTILDIKQAALEKHWEESLQRIANEQDLYQAQLQDVDRLKKESERLRSITDHLTSFVSSISAVTERLAPKLNQSCLTGDQDNNIMMLLEEINAVQPDSQQRVDAIRGAEEERQTKSANRTNPLDSELIKTKGLLRAPSERDKRDVRDCGSNPCKDKDKDGGMTASKDSSSGADRETSSSLNKDGSSGVKETGVGLNKDGSSGVKENGLSLNEDGSSGVKENGLSLNKDGSSGVKENGLSLNKDGSSGVKENGLSLTEDSGSNCMENSGSSLSKDNGSSLSKDNGSSVIKDGVHMDSVVNKNGVGSSPNKNDMKKDGVGSSLNMKDSVVNKDGVASTSNKKDSAVRRDIEEATAAEVMASVKAFIAASVTDGLTGGE